jgi:hypothetical protein
MHTDRAASSRKKTRFIIEIRCEAIPEFIDIRGKIVSAIFPIARTQMQHWRADPGQVLFTNDIAQPRDQFVVGVRRSLFVLEDSQSLGYFLERAEELFQNVYPFMASGWQLIDRIGVRFIEVVRSPRPTHDALRAFVLEGEHLTRNVLTH